MLALFSNLGFPEMLVIGVVALLLFGKRLPEMAVRAAAQVARARRSLDDMWRQTGLDDELRRVRRDIEVEQRKLGSQVPDWRADVPSWRKLEGGVREFKSGLESSLSEAAKQGQPAGEAATQPTKLAPMPPPKGSAPPAPPLGFEPEGKPAPDAPMHAPEEPSASSGPQAHPPARGSDA